MTEQYLPLMGRALGEQLLHWYDKVRLSKEKDTATLSQLAALLSSAFSPSGMPKEDQQLLAHIAWEPTALTLLIDWTRELLSAADPPGKNGEITLHLSEHYLATFFRMKKQENHWVPGEGFFTAHDDIRRRSGLPEGPLGQLLLQNSCAWFVSHLVEKPLRVLDSDREVVINVHRKDLPLASFSRSASTTDPSIRSLDKDFTLKPMGSKPTPTTSEAPATRH